MKGILLKRRNPKRDFREGIDFNKIAEECGADVKWAALGKLAQENLLKLYKKIPSICCISPTITNLEKKSDKHTVMKFFVHKKSDVSKIPTYVDYEPKKFGLKDEKHKEKVEVEVEVLDEKIKAYGNPRIYAQPTEGGLSIGDENQTSEGTLGIVGDNDLYWTCNHVVGDPFDDNSGIIMRQPASRMFGSLTQVDLGPITESVEIYPIGHPFMLFNTVDFVAGRCQPIFSPGSITTTAMGQPLPQPTCVQRDIHQNPTVVGTNPFPFPGTPIRKMGAITGRTFGEVIFPIAPTIVDYGNDQAIFLWTVPCNIDTDEGDSGSAFYDNQDRLIGLGVSGSGTFAQAAPVQLIEWVTGVSI